MRAAKWLIEIGKGLIELGDHFFMQQAQLDSLGARREPPKETSELNDTIREAILVARAKSSDEDWLRVNGRRDQECVRYGITRDQAAGILAAGTKREKKNGSAVGAEAPIAASSTSTLTSPAQKVGGKNLRNIFDHAEWGTFPLENGGNPDQPPARMFREITDEDKGLVILVRAQCIEHKKDWDELRHKLACVRRLTTQQIAGIIAVHNRTKTLKAPVAQA